LLENISINFRRQKLLPQQRIETYSWPPVAHTYNLSYSGGRDQEGHSSKPPWANSLRDPIPRNPSQKRTGGVAQRVGLEFKLQYHKKKKNY
jgi:hypothetical protein